MTLKETHCTTNTLGALHGYEVCLETYDTDLPSPEQWAEEKVLAENRQLRRARVLAYTNLDQLIAGELGIDDSLRATVMQGWNQHHIPKGMRRRILNQMGLSTNEKAPKALLSAAK